MFNNRARPLGPQHVTLAVVRIIFGSFFLASAAGAFRYEPLYEFARAAIADTVTADLVTNSFVFIAAFMIMTGKFQRLAALLLANYLFWSGFLYTFFKTGPDVLETVWTNTLLVASLVLVALTVPGGSSGFRLRTKTVTPRKLQPIHVPDYLRHERKEPSAPITTPVPQPEPVAEMIDPVEPEPPRQEKPHYFVLQPPGNDPNPPKVQQEPEPELEIETFIQTNPAVDAEPSEDAPLFRSNRDRTKKRDASETDSVNPRAAGVFKALMGR